MKLEILTTSTLINHLQMPHNNLPLSNLLNEFKQMNICVFRTEHGYCKKSNRQCPATITPFILNN